MDRNEFLHILLEQIRTRRARPMIKKEMEAHIEDQKCAFMAEGMAPFEAEQAAVREMGDPVEAGVALDRVHRPVMEWKVLFGVLCMSLLGFVIQVLVVMTAHPSGSANRVMRLWNGGLNRHMAAMAIGIIVMLIVCYVDYSFIGKHAVLFWGLANALLLFSAVAGPVVNGRPHYIIPASCITVPFYAGVVYHFRGQGTKGLTKSVACLCVTLAIMVFYYTLSMVFLIGCAGGILIHVAIYKKWFGSHRKKLYLGLWSVTVLPPLLFFGVNTVVRGRRYLADYQLLRMKVWLHPEQYTEYNYTLHAVAKAAQAVQNGSSWVEANMLSAIRNDYLWLYLFKYLGTWKGLLLTALVIGFWAFLLRTVHRQKNQLGYIISLGCVLVLSLQTVLYMGVNFRMVPATAAYMPFLSSGGALLIVSYFYMGMLLSVCRNSRVVKN